LNGTPAAIASQDDVDRYLVMLDYVKPSFTASAITTSGLVVGRDASSSPSWTRSA
jgi:hypothetical protein